MFLKMVFTAVVAFGTKTTVSTGALRSFATAARDSSSFLGETYRMNGLLNVDVSQVPGVKLKESRSSGPGFAKL